MIKRNMLMNNAINRESMSKFVKELTKRSDNVLVSLVNLGSVDPAVAALIVDVVELWEAEKWRFLTIADNARLNPTGHVFPNSNPAYSRL